MAGRNWQSKRASGKAARSYSGPDSFTAIRPARCSGASSRRLKKSSRVPLIGGGGANPVSRSRWRFVRRRAALRRGSRAAGHGDDHARARNDLGHFANSLKRIAAARGKLIRFVPVPWRPGVAGVENQPRPRAALGFRSDTGRPRHRDETNEFAARRGNRFKEFANVQGRSCGERDRPRVRRHVTSAQRSTASHKSPS